MDLTEAYGKIWSRKLVDAQPPSQQSIDRVNWTAELFPDSKDAGPLFDFGTGSGAMLDKGVRRGWKVSGSDVSSAVAQLLGGQGFDVWTLDANRDRVPMDDASVGVVTLCDVIEHLVDPAHALQESRRLLRSGGLLYVATPNCSLWRRVATLAQGLMYKTSGDPELRDGGHVGYYAPDDLKAFVSAAGFADVKIHLRKADPCPPHVWSALQALGAHKREYHEHTYMIAQATKP